MDLAASWRQLPAGARAAIEQQWIGVAARALACGAAVVDAEGRLIAAGRNHAYDPRGEPIMPLQHCRIAHAELNALALVATEADHATLTLWSTQHPCAMCAAAAQFIGVGRVCFIADDPSDDAPASAIVASRGQVPYERGAGPAWATVCNLLFLYTSAVLRGPDARNLRINRERWPRLLGLVLELARDDQLGQQARAQQPLLSALGPHEAAIAQAAAEQPA